MKEKDLSAQIGLIGLAVMGRNLALNLADHGFRVAVYNRTTETMEAFLEEAIAEEPASDRLVGCSSLEELLAVLEPPRKVLLLVKSGPAVDAVTRQLIEAGLEPADLVVDCGNSRWTDTIRREKEYAKRLKFFGSGVSGGELGARFGPSLMPGGDPDSWEHLRPFWEAIAAKVDPETGRALEDAAPGRPVEGGVPCTALMGPDGAGHYVKMVHNGIEYADIQLICEAYDLLRRGGGMTPDEIADVFAEWNKGDLSSYLVEITADILKQRDPEDGDRYFVDVVLDAAGQKGTGRWTATDALDMGIPATGIAEAVFARSLSALKEERVEASAVLGGPRPSPDDLPREQLIEETRQALYCSKICAYAQGFQLMRAAQAEYGWDLDFGTIARIWRGGCIIRARFLQKITDAYERTPALANLLLDPYFKEAISEGHDAWRRVVARAVRTGVPVPAFASTLSWYDGYRTDRLPAALLQAQRDYFGAHTYERTDAPRGTFFHLDWPDPERPQREVRKE